MGVKDGYIITNLSSSIRQRGSGVAPYTFGVRGVATLRNTCIPYSSFPGGSKPAWDRGDCGIPDTTIILPAIDGTTPVYTPEIFSTNWYTEIIDAEVFGTTSTHVGSIYLNSGTLNEIGVLVCTTDIPTHISTQIKRFTDNVLLTDFSAGAQKCGYSNTSSVTVPEDDWYDIYLSGTLAATTSSLEGIYIKYII